MEEMYNPQLMSQLLKKRDFDGYTAFDLIIKNQLHEIIQTKVADRVLKMQWESKIDASAPILE
jgi:hypothetical protein